MARIGIDVRKYSDFGIGTYVRNLVRQLAANLQNDELVLFHKSGDEDAGFPDNVELVAEDAALYSIKELFSLGLKSRSSKLDLLHSPHYVLPYGSGCRLVVTIHDLIHLLFSEYLSGAEKLYANHFLRRAVAKSEVIFTVSNYSKHDIVKHLGASEEKVIVSYNGIDGEYFAKADDELATRLRKRLQLDGPYLLYVGNNKPHKNLITALKAFKYFRKRAGSKWQFLLAGGCFSDPKTGAEILCNVENMGIADAVNFSGYLSQPELVSIYQGASMFVFPSLYEGFGLPPLEAMAAGVPVVSSNAAAMPEVLGDAALYVEPLDDVMMSEQMLKLIENEALQKEMIAKGLDQAKQYTWEKTLAATVAGYKRALA